MTTTGSLLDSDSDSELIEFSESMSAKEVSTWLNRNGIPEKFCDKFEGT